jgi:Holliday junction resolvasome RuvABC DNA-binding subunit
VAENIDLKKAAYNLAHDLRDYRQLGSLHKGVEQAKQQLSILDAFTAQKQQAMTTLMNLQLAGFSEKEITELVELVSRWNKSWRLGNPGNGQGNGRGSCQQSIVR